LLVTLYDVFSAGILDEVLNRLRFDLPIGATVLQSDGGRKPATHFVNEDMKVLSDTRVRKGAVTHCNTACQSQIYSILIGFYFAVL